MTLTLGTVPAGAALSGAARAVASGGAGALVGPPARAEVIGAGAGGLVVGGPGRSVVLVVGPGSPRLPLTVHVDADLARIAPGSSVRIGAGALVLEGLAVTVARWFDPAVRLDGRYQPGAVAALAAVVADHPGGDAALGADRVAALAAALGGDGDLPGAVAGLVGRGGGSTPAGDDVLAGALAALAAVGSPLAARLAAAVAPHRGATTRLSAALLDHAARAEVAEAAVPLLRVLTDPASPDPRPADPRPTGHDPAGPDPTGIAAGVRRSAAPLLALGHTSGHHLAEGIALGAGAAA